MAVRTQEIQARDLTSGSIQVSIWRMAIPMIIEMVVLNISMGLDTFWVGQRGEAAVAAVTVSMSIRWVVNSLANGLGIGGMATVARRTGEGNQNAASHAATQTIILGIVVSVFLAVVGNLMARPSLVLLGSEPDVLPLAIAYLRVTMTGMFTMVLIFVINAMLRGAGEAQIAMRALILATAVTVALEPVLVLGLGPAPELGIAGAAWSFVLGYGAGVIYQLWVLLSGRARLGVQLSTVRPDFPLMGSIVRIALPSTVQMTLRSSSRLAIIAIVGAFGTAALAAYGVANRLLMFVVIPTFGLGNACSALVGQNLGAEKPERAERIGWWVSAYAALYTAAIVALVVVSAPTLIDLFVKDATAEVVDLGVDYLHIVGPSLLAMTVGIVLARGFDGAGNTVPAMVVNLITLWGIEVGVAFFLSRSAGMGPTGVWVGRALAGIANGVLFAVWFRRGRWKLKEV
jgi:putative MATE family efflux protein